MKRTLIAVAAAACVLAASPRAEAKFFDIWVSGLGGYEWGSGTTEKDFYKNAGGIYVGAEAGIKILFLGVFVDYQRFLAAGEGQAHLLSFNLGGDWTINLVGGLDLVIRGAGGFYYAVLDDPPTVVIDKVEVTSESGVTRGVGVRAGAGLRYTFAKVFSIGVTPQIGYHYYFGSSDTSLLEDNSHGVDFNVMAYLRLGFGFGS